MTDIDLIPKRELAARLIEQDAELKRLRAQFGMVSTALLVLVHRDGGRVRITASEHTGVARTEQLLVREEPTEGGGPPMLIVEAKPRDDVKGKVQPATTMPANGDMEPRR